MNFSKSDLLLVSCFWNIVCIYVNEYMWKYHQICFNLQQYSYCFEIIFKKIAKIFSRKYVFLERRQEICRIFIRRAKRNKKKELQQTTGDQAHRHHGTPADNPTKYPPERQLKV